MGEKLNQEQRLQVVVMWSQGRKVTEIAAAIPCHRASVYRLIKHVTVTGSLKDNQRSGRPRKTSERDDRLVQGIAKRRPFVTAKGIRETVTQNGIHVSDATIKRRLNDAHPHGRVARCVPMISEKNRLARLAFAHKYYMKSVSFWKKVIWTDEVKLHEGGGRRTVWRGKGDAHNSSLTTTSVKFPSRSWSGAVFRFHGIGSIVRINGLMDMFQFVDVLCGNLLFSAHKMGLGDNFILQQDNDPKHSAKYTQKFLEDSGIRVVKWPAQSPDLNPIENWWSILKRKIREDEKIGNNVLWEVIQCQWENISRRYMRKLVRSMPKRLKEVIAMKGMNTHYC